jgi:serine/threonine-protein kinase
MRPEQRSDPELRERFLQEGRLACRCSHPNVITAYVTDEDECGPYIVMERLPGHSLRDVMNSGALSTPVAAIKIGAQVAEALLYLHEIGNPHRDIKPPNVFVSSNRHAKIFDFGIARGGGFGLTRAGDVIGTPSYMAPEQILGKPVDERTDIYSFGVLLFEMLALSLPYQGSTIEEITAHVEGSRLGDRRRSRGGCRRGPCPRIGKQRKFVCKPRNRSGNSYHRSASLADST